MTTEVNFENDKVQVFGPIETQEEMNRLGAGSKWSVVNSEGGYSTFNQYVQNRGVNFFVIIPRGYPNQKYIVAAYPEPSGEINWFDVEDRKLDDEDVVQLHVEFNMPHDLLEKVNESPVMLTPKSQYGYSKVEEATTQPKVKEGEQMSLNREKLTGLKESFWKEDDPKKVPIKESTATKKELAAAAERTKSAMSLLRKIHKATEAGSLETVMDAIEKSATKGDIDDKQETRLKDACKRRKEALASSPKETEPTAAEEQGVTAE